MRQTLRPAKIPNLWNRTDTWPSNWLGTDDHQVWTNQMLQGTRVRKAGVLHPADAVGGGKVEALFTVSISMFKLISSPKALRRRSSSMIRSSTISAPPLGQRLVSLGDERSFPVEA